MEGLAKKFSWSLFSSIIRIGFQFIGIIILGRLLSPNEFGVIGIMTIFMVVGDMLIDSGMNGAILHKKNVTKIDFSTLFVYNLIVSIVIYCVIFLSAPLIENFYGVDHLSKYIRVYCLGFFSFAIGISQISKLQKNMDFRSLALSTFFSNAIAMTFAICLAIKGAGIWALIAQYIVATTTETIFAIIFAKMGISFKFSTKSFKEQFGFGMWLMASSLLETISNNIYSNVIPKYGTLMVNGYYAQANRISNVPSSIVKRTTSQVLFPALCATEEIDKVNKYRIYSCDIMYISCFFSFLISIYSKSLLLLIVGSQWIDASPFLSILSISCLFDIFQNLQRNLVKSLGKTKNIFKLTVFSSLLRMIVLIVSIIIGDLWFIVYGVLLSNMINSYIWMLFISKSSEYKVIMQIKDFYPYFVASLVSVGVLYYIFEFFDLNLTTRLLFIPLAIIIYVSFLRYNYSQIRLYSKAISIIRNLKSNRRYS